jgi:tetratricopeptide (TPR) repeat protein
MKAEHRHELKTNELADWIVNFPQWAKENATTIIYVSVLVVVVAGVYFWKVYEKRIASDRERLKLTGLVSQVSEGKTQILQAHAQGIDTSYILIQAADELQNVAKDAKAEQMAALALIKRAEALRTELHYRFGNISSEVLTAQINQAKDSYTRAIEKSSNSSLLTAAAKLGLGLCEEELGNFEQARQIYGEIAANADFEGTVPAAQAKLRLLTMADYRQKVVFKPSPARAPAAPAEFIQPEIKLEAPEGFQTQEGTIGTAELNLPSQL